MEIVHEDIYECEGLRHSSPPTPPRLAPQNFEVKHETASPVSEEIKKILITAHPKNRTLNKSTQTGRYDTWNKQGNIRCQSVKMPSEECKKNLFLELKPGPAPKSTPTIARTVILNSRNKRKYCDDLIAEIKNQAEFDKMFEPVGHSIEKRIAKNLPPQ